jgi:hypothetical protein
MLEPTFDAVEGGGPEAGGELGADLDATMALASRVETRGEVAMPSWRLRPAMTPPGLGGDRYVAPPSKAEAIV